MIYGTNEDRRNAIEKKIEAKQALMRYYPIIKKIIQQYDGKVYNCKLDKALSEATKDHPEDIRGRVYGHVAYGDNIEICGHKDNESMSYFYMRKKDLKDRRIDAAQWFEIINANYAKQLQEIDHLRRDLETIEETLKQIDILKKQMRALIEPLSYTVRDAYGISRITI